MKLSEDQHSQLTVHIAEKWAPPATCTVCGHNSWNVSDVLYELREFHGGSMVIGGSAIIPVSPVTCNNCGNTVLINPLVAGIELKEGKDD